MQNSMDLFPVSRLLVQHQASIQQALEVIDAGALQFALVVNEGGMLVGTVTDGDIRRGLLKGLALHDPVSSVMNANPLTATETTPLQLLEEQARARKLKYIPILDVNRQPVRIHEVGSQKVASIEHKPNQVVLMVGGLGTRLAPLTNHCPKPLLKVGNKPILERIILHFKRHGFHRFTLCVNYLAQLIVDYFGDGSAWNVEIEYVYENQRMGTAGALSLLPRRPDEAFIVMNGDLLTKAHFTNLLQFHQTHGSAATMGVREYMVKIPYGVVQTEHLRITGLVEKPTYTYFVNAGIYCLTPDMLDLIPENQFYDMPTLFEQAIAQGRAAFTYPIREYWLDIGQPSDFERANEEVEALFDEA
jgi:dTDP-glucose pyrophosphorylase